MNDSLKRLQPNKLLLMLTVVLVGCQTSQTQTFETKTLVDLKLVCVGLPPIRYSRKDTVKTQEQVVGQNAFVAALCQGIE